MEKKVVGEKTNSAREHLDRSGLGYLRQINPLTGQAFGRVLHRYGHVIDDLGDKPKGLILGTGQGEELLSLADSFEKRGGMLVGIDLSHLAIASSRDNSGSRDNIFYVQGNVTNLPFNGQIFDVVINSSLMHEVFSYTPNSNQAWVSTISDSIDVLRPGGKMAFRDFNLPDIEQPIKVNFTSELISNFYEYFRRDFRVLRAWTPEATAGLVGKREEYDQEFPSTSQNSVELPVSSVAEILIHFRHFWHAIQGGETYLGDINWKEINERYFIPNPISGAPKFTMADYVNAVKTASGNKAECIRTETSYRPQTTAFLHDHVRLELPAKNPSGEDLIDSMTQTMELTFQRVR